MGRYLQYRHNMLWRVIRRTMTALRWRTFYEGLMFRRRPRSIGAPILLGVVSVGLAIAMLVAWILVLVYSDLKADWLLILGILSLTWIGLVLALFAVYLVRQILEVRRQVRFVDSVTHELKSPLASLRMGLQTLARPQLSDEQRDSLRGMMLADGRCAMRVLDG